MPGICYLPLSDVHQNNFKTIIVSPGLGAREVSQRPTLVQVRASATGECVSACREAERRIFKLADEAHSMRHACFWAGAISLLDLSYHQYYDLQRIV